MRASISSVMPRANVRRRCQRCQYRDVQLSTGTEGRALELFGRYGYPDWLREHSLVVGRIAAVIAEAHVAAGATLDRDAVTLAAYLHDLGKSPRFAGDPRQHHELSAVALRSEGLSPLAELARRHPVYAPADPDLVPRDLGERIVYYADRRGERRVVSLEERFAGQAERHPEHAQKIRDHLAAAWEIERLVFAGLPFGPDALAGLVG